MSTPVLMVVLLAALMHAFWNSLISRASGPVHCFGFFGS